MKVNQAIDIFVKGMRQERKAKATIGAYLSHVRAFLGFKFSDSSATKEEKAAEFLSWLALNRSADTQKNALNALACFYRLLGNPLGELPRWVRPKEKITVPTWVTVAESCVAIIAAPKDSRRCSRWL